MERGELPAIAGTVLIVLLTILAFTLKATDNSSLTGFIFFGTLFCGILFMYTIITTKVLWARILSKVFFIIPIAIAILFISGMGLEYVLHPANLTSTYFLMGIFIWSIVILIYALEIYLFVKVEKTSTAFMKVLASIVAGSIYLVTAIIGAAMIMPPSFGTYGSPLYRPKRK